MNAEKITWDNGWVNITTDHRKQWKRAYPGVNIQTELEAMNQWLWANPARRKKNYPRFIISWLKREQEVSLVRPSRVEPAVHCSGNNVIPEPKSEEEVEEAVRANKESGNSDLVAETLKQLRRRQPE